jgi:hypothetical protein
MTTATQQDIVWHFLDLIVNRPDWQGINWGTARDNSVWEVTDDTYINGVALIIDDDYYMGYLLEVVEKSTSVVSYLVIAAFHGPKTIHDSEDGREYIINWDHDSTFYEGKVGTFGDRKVDIHQARKWAIDRYEYMRDSYEDIKRKRRDSGHS